MAKLTAAAALALGALHQAAADIPVHCLFDEVATGWTFSISEATGDNTLQCPSDPSQVIVAKELSLKLMQPDVVVSSDGSTGWWSLVYDEGFLIDLNGQQFFSFFNYTMDPATNATVSNCGRTQVGWVHDAPLGPGQAPLNWGCFYGSVTSAQAAPAPKPLAAPQQLSAEQAQRTVRDDPAFAAAINAEQSLWRAGAAHPFAGMPAAQALRQVGKPALHRRTPPKHLAKPLSAELRAGLPASWDWSNVNGVNYLPPVLNQGQCGSCYSHGSLTSLAARLRIATGMNDTSMYSRQDIVSCSPYSQGCDGGFGRMVYEFMQDFSIASDSCYPYTSGNGVTPPCGSGNTCGPADYRWATQPYFIGGYYGASTADSMMYDLVNNGPFSVEFEVLSDFTHYTGGIYVPTSAGTQGLTFNPFVLVNHEVFVVGYGEENGVPYWRAQNSWSTNWGEAGFFRILRSNATQPPVVGFESMPSAAFPVPL